MTARKAVILAVALGFAMIPIPPRLIEQAYAATSYSILQRLVTSLSNLAPFALFDAFVLGIVATWLLVGARDVSRRGWLRAAARAGVRTIVWAAAVYLLFLFTWGLNYRRVRLIDRLAFDANAVTEDAVVRLLETSVERLNATHARAHAEGWPSEGTIEPALAGAFDRTARDLGTASAGRRLVLGRPKHTIFDWYLRRAGVDGMTDPFMLETLVAGDLLPFERPFVVAHEWSHLAGLADEGEANFGGWLACMRGSPPDQYSAWIFMYGELIRVARPRDRGAIAARLGIGPREDLRAIRDRVIRQVNPHVSAAGFRVYDSYLKANRVEAGAASYGEVVKLVLGLRVARL